MSESDAHWRKVDDLLNAAVDSQDLQERRRLIDEAVFWRGQAIDAERAQARRDRKVLIRFPTDPPDPPDG